MKGRVEICQPFVDEVPRTRIPPLHHFHRPQGGPPKNLEHQVLHRTEVIVHESLIYAGPVSYMSRRDRAAALLRENSPSGRDQFFPSARFLSGIASPRPPFVNHAITFTQFN